MVEGDGTMEGGEMEPGSQVVAGDVVGDSGPDFEGSAVRGRVVRKVDLL